MVEKDSAELVTRCARGTSKRLWSLWSALPRDCWRWRSQLSEKVARRVDPEDVVQSAYKSFFAGALDDRYVLQRTGDLWHLLAAITLHKLHHQVRRHTAETRSVEREAGFGQKAACWAFRPRSWHGSHLRPRRLHLWMSWRLCCDP